MKKYYSHVRATAFSAIKESLVKYIDDKYASLGFNDSIDLKNTRMVDFYLFHVIETDKQVFFRDILTKCISDKKEQEAFIEVFNQIEISSDIIEMLLLLKLINNDRNIYDKDFIDTSFRAVLIDQIKEAYDLICDSDALLNENSNHLNSGAETVLVMERIANPVAEMEVEINAKLKSKNALLNCVRIIKTSMDNNLWEFNN